MRIRERVRGLADFAVRPCSGAGFALSGRFFSPGQLGAYGRSPQAGNNLALRNNWLRVDGSSDWTRSLPTQRKQPHPCSIPWRLCYRCESVRVGADGRGLWQGAGTCEMRRLSASCTTARSPPAASTKPTCLQKARSACTAAYALEGRKESYITYPSIKAFQP